MHIPLNFEQDVIDLDKGDLTADRPPFPVVVPLGGRLEDILISSDQFPALEDILASKVDVVISARLDK